MTKTLQKVGIDETSLNVIKAIHDNPRERAEAALFWSSHEEIPHVQGKRNASKTVGAERVHQRADKL